MRVGLATCRVLPEPDHDEAPLLAALRATGVDARTIAWDDEGDDPASVDVCVLRATWNYPRHPEAFAAWLGRAAGVTRLLNPLDAVRWNLEKTYLLELERGGVPIVQTEFVARGASASLGEVCARRGWGEVVVKPTLSAASFLTRRFGQGECEAAQRFLDDHAAVRGMMIQPFMTSVETYGEHSIVWIEGEVTHAVHKTARFDGGDERVNALERIDDADLGLAERVMMLAPRDLLYARIDVIHDEDGAPRLSELELIEPSLFFPYSGRALERMVAGIRRRA